MGLDSPALRLKKKKVLRYAIQKTAAFRRSPRERRTPQSVEEEVSEREGLRVPTRGVPSGGRR